MIVLPALLLAAGAPEIGPPAITVDPCIEVDAEEVRRLTAMELRTWRWRTSPETFEVLAVCRDGIEELRLTNRSRGNVTVRSIDLGAPLAEDQDAKARELALAIAELLRRADMESTPEEPAAPSPPVPPAPAPVPPPAQASETKPWNIELGATGVIAGWTGGEMLFGADVAGRAHVARWVIVELRLGARKSRPVDFADGSLDGQGVAAAVGLSFDATPGVRQAGVSFGARLGVDWLRYAASTVKSFLRRRRCHGGERYRDDNGVRRAFWSALPHGRRFRRWRAAFGRPSRSRRIDLGHAWRFDFGRRRAGGTFLIACAGVHSPEPRRALRDRTLAITLSACGETAITIDPAEPSRRQRSISSEVSSCISGSMKPKPAPRRTMTPVSAITVRLRKTHRRLPSPFRPWVSRIRAASPSTASSSSSISAIPRASNISGNVTLRRGSDRSRSMVIEISSGTDSAGFRTGSSRSEFSMKITSLRHGTGLTTSRARRSAGQRGQLAPSRRRSRWGTYRLYRDGELIVERRDNVLPTKWKRPGQ